MGPQNVRLWLVVEKQHKGVNETLWPLQRSLGPMDAGVWEARQSLALGGDVWRKDSCDGDGNTDPFWSQQTPLLRVRDGL